MLNIECDKLRIENQSLSERNDVLEDRVAAGEDDPQDSTNL